MTRSTFALCAAVCVAACSSDKTTAPPPGFLHGQVAVIVNSTGRALTMFQLASPTTQQTVSLGGSNAITPVDASVRGTLALVPLGDAASAALVDLTKPTITRFFLYPAGFATGSAFVDDTTILIDNTGDGTIGRVTVHQTSDSISDTVVVAPMPSAIVVSGSRAYVISANEDANFNTLGNGILTAVNLSTMTVAGTVTLGGTNSTAGAVGPDGKLYILNTGDFTNPGSMSIVDPSTLTVEQTVTNMVVGPGAISIDASGLAYISSFSAGTVIYNTTTRSYLRGPNNPVCAPLPNNGGCRGAFDAEVDSKGNVYQTFFGGTIGKQAYPGQVFVYAASTYALTDSVSAGVGPTALRIASF
jgi:hypothetical protein